MAKKEEPFVYPVLSKELMTAMFGSAEEREVRQRARDRIWRKTHYWAKPICAKCGTRTGGAGVKIGLEKGKKYYCAKCSARPTRIEIEGDTCDCLMVMVELFDRINIQLWTGDAHESPSIKCRKHNTQASFSYINQYD